MPVSKIDILPSRPDCLQHVHAGYRCCTRARCADLHFGDIFANELHGIEDGCSDDDRRAVLVVVEHRDVHPSPQVLFDVEAIGSLDVLQIDATETRLKRCNDLDEFLRVGLVHLDVDAVDPGEFLEENRLAFHDWLACQRPDIAQTEYCGAVGNDRHKIALGRIGVGLLRISGDFLAWRRNSQVNKPMQGRAHSPTACSA